MNPNPNPATRWQPGQSGNPAGKPKGTKDRAWSTLDYWMDKIADEWDELTPIQRTHVSLELFKIIAARRPLPPGSPEESVKRVEVIMGNVTKLECAPQENERPSPVQ